MKHTQVLVLGGGMAGVEGALAAQRVLRRRHAVRLISAVDRIEIKQSLPRIAFGLKQPESASLALNEALSSRGVEFTNASIESINTDERLVRTAGGVETRYECLLVALGAKFNKSALAGASAHGRFLYSVDDALLMRRDVAAIEEGPFTSVVCPGNHWEGPALETVFHAHKFFFQHGKRKNVDIRFITHKARPFEELGAHVSSAIESELEARGILVERSRAVHRVGPASIETDGGTVESGFTVLFLPHSAAPLLLESGLAEKNSLVKADERMRVRENLFAAGDCVEGTGVKLGFSALSQAVVAGRNAALTVLGKEPLATFTPSIVYVMELGGDAGLLITAKRRNGGWEAKVRKGGEPLLKKMSFEKDFIKNAGLVHYVMGEKIG